MNLRLHHTNESGTAPAIVDQSPITEKSSPQPDSTSRVTTPRRFDITAGLQYKLNRHYDPTPGQWLSEAPVGYAGSDKNLTRYVTTRPS